MSNRGKRVNINSINEIDNAGADVSSCPRPIHYIIVKN